MTRFNWTIPALDAWAIFKANSKAQPTPDQWVASLAEAEQIRFLENLTRLVNCGHMTRNEFEEIEEHKDVLEDLWLALHAERDRRLQELLRRQQLRLEAQHGLSFPEGERGTLSLVPEGHLSLVKER